MDIHKCLESVEFDMHQEVSHDISTSKSSPIKSGATSIEFRGYLDIQVENKKWFGKRWKRRFVLVSNGYLYVYSNEKLYAKNLRTIYPIYDFERVIAHENNDTFMLTFREAGRLPIVCSCKSLLERTEWVRRIDNAISFVRDSGFESGEKLRHKIPDFYTNITDDNEESTFGYSTVDESTIGSSGYSTVAESKERTALGSRDTFVRSSSAPYDERIFDSSGIYRMESYLRAPRSPSMRTESTALGSRDTFVRSSSAPHDERIFDSSRIYRVESYLRAIRSPSIRTESTALGSRDTFVRSSSAPHDTRIFDSPGVFRVESYLRNISPPGMRTASQHSTFKEDNEPPYVNLPSMRQCNSEPNRSRSPTSLWKESLPERTIGQSESGYDADEDTFVSDVDYQFHSESSDMKRKVHKPVRDPEGVQSAFFRARSSPNMTTGLGKPFMPEPEPYQTEVTENVQEERLQTYEKGSWRQCFRHSRNFENDAKRLLLEGTLPDHSLFQNISKEYGRKSEIVRIISNGICQNIKEQSNNIVHVWPAYRHEHGMDCSEDLIVFVVITNKQTNIQSDYEICKRHLNEISSLSENENKRIHDKEKLYDLWRDDLALYLKSKAKQLMENHKNLTWVTVSVIKSSGHDMDDHRMVQLPCIALYVQIKGLIPIDEDPFEQFLDSYPVDVREGVFSLYGLPTDLHQNVRIGCALDSGFGTKQGTVGPFFKYETDLHTYLLTSAHVLLDPEQMKKLLVDTNVYYGIHGTDAYQPPESISVEHNSRHHLGKLEFAVYRTGEQYKPGMEVALVRIDKQRVPIDGKFPTNETIDGYTLSLDDIDIYSKQLNGQDVYKYGSNTGLTKGKVRFDGGSVRTGVLKDHFLGMDLTLNEQIEIESADGGPFGEPGDSGALVFTRSGDRLFVIGIVEGGIGNTCMVTPIRDIIDVLSQFISLYRDPPTDTCMDFEEQTSNITLKLYHVRSNNTLQSAGINRRLSAEIRRHTAEIQANTEHKFDSVKSELTAIKVHFDTKIDKIENSNREIIESLKALAQTVKNSYNVSSPNTEK